MIMLMKKKTLKKVLIVLLCEVLGFCCYKVYPFIVDWLNANKDSSNIKEAVDKNTNDEEFNREAWDALYAQNSDLKAYMVMKSDDTANTKIDIELPIVQTTDNSYYLNHSFTKEWNTMGNPFFSFDSALDGTDDNVMIYGHYVSYDKSKMFSPLNLLLNSQDAYEHCKIFRIYYENEVAEYEIVSVIQFDYSTEYKNHEYTMRHFYDQETFNEWDTYNKEHNTIQSSATTGLGDKFVTLQTCTHIYSSLRTLVVAKEISRKIY